MGLGLILVLVTGLILVLVLDMGLILVLVLVTGLILVLVLVTGLILVHNLLLESLRIFHTTTPTLTLTHKNSRFFIKYFIFLFLKITHIHITHHTFLGTQWNTMEHNGTQWKKTVS
jgi:hypothetical protein